MLKIFAVHFCYRNEVLLGGIYEDVVKVKE
jgi:hypothetical protein